jgi:hypothetical protein
MNVAGRGSPLAAILKPSKEVTLEAQLRQGIVMTLIPLQSPQNKKLPRRVSGRGLRGIVALPAVLSQRFTRGC